MKMLVMNHRFFMLIFPFLLALFVLVGCGESEENNNRPVIEALSDQTLDMGNTVEVKVIITDADGADTHIINASSDNTTIAAISVDKVSLTITGKAAGTTTITVIATDDSGQDNAEANPVTFKVTVNNPPPDETPEQPNDPYTPLEGLSVSDGRIQFLFFSAGRCIYIDGSTINGVTYNVHYSKWQRRDDVTSPWVDVPGTESDDGLCSYSPTGPGQYRIVCEISFDGVKGKYTSENILEI